MQITFFQSGGFAGALRGVRIDSLELPERQRARPGERGHAPGGGPRCVCERLGGFEGEVVARWENDGRRMTLVEPFAYVDPRLARWPVARLLGIDADALLEGQAGGPAVPRDETLLRKLFELLVTLGVRVAAEAAGARVRHLRWLTEKVGSDLLDAVVVTTGGEAYRRADGIAVVPAGVLGP